MPASDPIVIPIEGDPKDFIADAKKVQEQMDILAHRLDKVGVSNSAYNQAVARSKTVMNEQVDTTKKVSMSMTDLRSSYMILMDAVRIGQQVWAQTAGETLKYDEAVRKLAEVSGTGAEESSRLIQVMDDFKISADDVFMATKALTKEGLSPTIETLARLSDEYNKLNPGQEQAEFLMKNFGKSGLKFAEAMSKGGDALKQMGTEVEKSLIRTDAQIAKTRLAELAFDKWADKIQAVKVEIGSGLIGVMDGSTAAIHKNAMAIFKQNEGYNLNLNRMANYTDAQRTAWEEAEKLATEQYLLANGMDITKDSADGLTVSVEEQAAALESLSKANASTLTGAIAITKSHEDMQTSIEGINAKMQDLQKEKEKLYPYELEKIQEIEDKQQDLRDEYAKTVDEFKAGMQEKFAMMAMEKIAMSDNVAGFNENEMTRAQAVLETMDVVTAAAMSEQLAMEAVTTAVANGQITVQDFGRITQEAMADGVVSIDEVKKAIDRVPKNNTITFNIQTIGDYPLGYYSSPERPDRAAGQRKHAGGGDFMIPMSYGNEGFRMGNGDTASGGERVTVTPKGQQQATSQNINIDYNKLSRAIVSAIAQGSNQ